MKKFLFLTFLFFSISNLILAQGFHKVFFDSLDNGIKLHTSVLTANGELLIVGEHCNQKALLLKMDSNGKLLWNKVFGGKTSQPDVEFKTIISTNDSCYMIAGSAYNKNSHLRDALCVKINSNGDTLWQRTYSKVNQNFELYSIQQTFDSGYVLCGYSQQNGLPNRKVFAGKISMNGSMQWARYYNEGNNDNIGYTVKQTPDSGYIIIGDVQSNALLLKLAPTGNIQWVRKFNYPKAGGSNGNDIVVENDGFICYLNSQMTPFLKTDFSGNIQWCKTFNGSTFMHFADDAFPRIGRTSDSCYIILYGDCFRDDKMIKMTLKGNIVWSKGFWLIPLEVKEKKNKELLITGNGPMCGVAPGYAQPQIGILKTDSAGYLQNCKGSDAIDTNSYVPVNNPISMLSDSNASESITILLIDSIHIISFDGCVNLIGGIHKTEIKNEVIISPNPSNGIFNLKTKEMDPFRIIIYNTLGETVFQSELKQQTFEIDLSKQPQGIYYYKLFYDDQKTEKGKLIIRN